MFDVVISLALISCCWVIFCGILFVAGGATVGIRLVGLVVVAVVIMVRGGAAVEGVADEATTNFGWLLIIMLF